MFRPPTLSALFAPLVLLLGGSLAAPQEPSPDESADRWPEAEVAIYEDRGWEQSPRALAVAYLDELWNASGAPGISAAVFRDGRLVFSEAITIFADDPLLFEPGSHYLYTSYGASLLQGVIETASSMGFEEYLRRRVWEPAGMLRTALDVRDRIVPHRAGAYEVDGVEIRHHPWEDVSYKWAGGGMISTAEDLGRLGVALLEGRLTKPETVRLMLAPQLSDAILYYRGDEPAMPLRWRQAFMWRIRTDEAGRDYVNHCGSVKGYNACLILYVAENLVAATADNGGALGLRPTRALADFFRLRGE